ncbi:MAG: hypothetical protein ACLUAO_05815 [Streptococcus sp.]
MNIPLLSNDVYALTQPEIQGHFLTTGDQARGVNVLAVQTQTPWGQIMQPNSKRPLIPT